MSTGTRVPLHDAQQVAYGLAVALASVQPGQHQSGCERAEVAGSIRRRRPDVGDIEILAIPRIAPVFGLFGDEPIGEINGLLEVRDGLLASGELAPHPTDPKLGRRYSKLIHVESGLQVDLFSVLPPATWGVLFLIRTGPAAYSQRFVTEARKYGFHVTDGALHRGSLGCGTYVCEVVPTPEETDVYGALGLPWVRPEERE